MLLGNEIPLYPTRHEEKKTAHLPIYLLEVFKVLLSQPTNFSGARQIFTFVSNRRNCLTDVECREVWCQLTTNSFYLVHKRGANFK